jgi:C-terminal processing protease CtpA/Prc
LTVATYVTPNGNEVDGIGVAPDIVVPADDRDSQLQRALDLLR